ncbi:MAG: PKD domain-containing protein [Bacteroidetes bacterium]|nr:MAG: PKD domain-containing protein [Bacteroidota bacterium]REK32618.1 MAG: PKD domain-containing protein [Bacteroidota bacterium]REK48935.1 MAG: PKD domain-containing protein [Bacteroidota bacterium]
MSSHNFQFSIWSIILIIFTSKFDSHAQKLPPQYRIIDQGTRLMVGNTSYTGFYDHYSINEIALEFPQSNYWSLLVSNFNDKINIPARVTINGVVFDSVGVRFKGSTSYSGSNSNKKSFNITLDAYKEDQEYLGYNIINLNNAYHDPSFMQEILYEYLIGKHVTSPKGNFAHLTINGNNWGVYANVQQVNRDLVKEWFPNKGGSLWRAKRPEGSPAPNGTRGDSLRSLHWLGNDTTAYMIHYNLKSGGLVDPHTKLKDFCLILDTVSNQHMEEVLADYLDVDNTLWFIASEILFADDDSYVIKGRSDYYFIIDSIDGRLTLIEMDGNDTFVPSTSSYSIFGNVNKPYYPLLYKLLNQSQLRQRYLAHFRTIVKDMLDTSAVFPMIDTYYSMIDSMVFADPVKNYTYTEFVDHRNVLKGFINSRKSYVLGRSEINVVPPVISNTIMYVDSTPWKRPSHNETVLVNTAVNSASGIDKVRLFFGTGLSGKFQNIEMHDDGLHNDQLAGDGIYGATIHGIQGGTRVRFYVEATASNSAKTVMYDPEGAEHDVYTYMVWPDRSSDTSVVINELMAKNTMTVTDSSGRYADWIELHNKSSQDKDISNFFLSDDQENLIKWKFPSGTIIPANDYLIVWADDNSRSGLYQTNFKLSADGDELYFLNDNLELVDEVSFGQQVSDVALARVPNGYGPFVNQAATFNYDNNTYPQISFGSNTIYGCMPLDVQFTNSTIDANAYLWDFGDNNTSTHPSPSHVYQTAGIYTVRLTAYNGQVASVDSIVDMITVGAARPFSFISDTIIAPGATYILSADPWYLDYLWSNGSTNMSILVDSSGTYCITLTDTNTCIDSACVYVALNTTGISSLIESSAIELFPNPVSDILHIRNKTSGSLNLDVYDFTARTVYHQILHQETRIDLSSQAPGVYFIRVNDRLFPVIKQN